MRHANPILSCSSNGEDSGVGTGCIQDPNTTECGCENSSGEFIVGSDSCS